MQHAATKEFVRVPWNKGKIAGQKPPLKRNEIWAIRVRLQFSGHIRDLALFNLAIDSKLRACDLVRMRVRDVIQSSRIAHRAIVMQRKTRRPVQCREHREVPGYRARRRLGYCRANGDLRPRELSGPQGPLSRRKRNEDVEGG